ncbi:alpha/beta fold hydrolase [Amycolatopsis sp. H20-H5]|uniref:alpha/beta fold hydrolase n=1 Tax=Amycolatopsis sp. H20-H5 TaxID=3046309 RepID=UPI002DBFADDC|nr:alpha/beta hydrolase [Amycolatopsis sp. H20-H5]MEC3979249.1 alpha/beta hydrolase [Amycolatopsis sp. H20-H5]
MTACQAQRDSVSWDPSRGHRFVTSDGTALHVESSGPVDSEVTLVLVHGWTQDHRTWDGVVARLGPSIRVLRYDLRGHGGSAPAKPGTASIATLADDLAELIADHAPAGPLVLAGHSMGGMTIMELARRHPDLVAERVAGAAFVATSSGQMDRITLGLPGIAGTGAAKFERRLAKLLARQRRDALPLSPAMVRPGARFLVFGSHPRRSDVDSVTDQLLCAHPASVAGFQDAISRHDCKVALAALRGTPAVVLVGESDRLCPLAHAKVIADELPDAEFVRYPGAGHMLPQERANEVGDRILTLVRSVVRR